MAIDFNKDTLTITLESGITEVDVREDLLEDGKDWYRAHPDNRKCPYPFLSDGGNPLTAVINQGGYVFLNNTAGWRLKPPEEDITIFFIGNLAVFDTSIASVVPTDGAFTAAIFGLQPITQGVVPQMRSQLAFSTFQNAVCLDFSNTSGKAVAGQGEVGLDNIGTRRLPSDNPDDTKAIADTNGLIQINLLSNMATTTETTDFSAGYHFRGDSPEIEFNAGVDLNLTNCSFENVELIGEMDGVNNIWDSEVKNITNFSGHIKNSDLDGDISINGAVELIDCYSGKAGLGYGRVTNIGTSTVIIRRMNGSIGLAGMTGGIHSVGVYGGRVVIEATCTGGTVYVRGDPYEVTDLSGGLVAVVSQTDSHKTTRIYQAAKLDINNPVETDEDGSIRFDDVVIDGETVGTTPNRTTTQSRTA